MKKIILQKENYPELIIRKSLYQFSNFNEWEIIEDEKDWIISVSNTDKIEEAQSTFSRLLNDNILRYELDKRTLFLREKIIKKSLEKIYNEL